jgi:hypothetical protein
MTVALYARVSSQRQTNAQTIEQQLDRLRTRVEEDGAEPAPACLVFRDELLQRLELTPSWPGCAARRGRLGRGGARLHHRPGSPGPYVGAPSPPARRTGALGLRRCVS